MEGLTFKYFLKALTILLLIYAVSAKSMNHKNQYQTHPRTRRGISRVVAQLFYGGRPAGDLPPSKGYGRGTSYQPAKPSSKKERSRHENRHYTRPSETDYAAWNANAKNYYESTNPDAHYYSSDQYQPHLYQKDESYSFNDAQPYDTPSYKETPPSSSHEYNYKDTPSAYSSYKDDTPTYKSSGESGYKDRNLHDSESIISLDIQPRDPERIRPAHSQHQAVSSPHHGPNFGSSYMNNFLKGHDHFKDNFMRGHEHFRESFVRGHEHLKHNFMMGHENLTHDFVRGHEQLKAHVASYWHTFMPTTSKVGSFPGYSERYNNHPTFVDEYSR